MNINVTQELKDFLVQFSGDPRNRLICLKEKIKELYIDDGATLVYNDRTYSKENIDTLLNDVLYDFDSEQKKEEKVKKKNNFIIWVIATSLLAGLVTFLTY